MCTFKLGRIFIQESYISSFHKISASIKTHIIKVALSMTQTYLLYVLVNVLQCLHEIV